MYSQISLKKQICKDFGSAFSSLREVLIFLHLLFLFVLFAHRTVNALWKANLFCVVAISCVISDNHKRDGVTLPFAALSTFQNIFSLVVYSSHTPLLEEE